MKEPYIRAKEYRTNPENVRFKPKLFRNSVNFCFEACRLITKQRIKFRNEPDYDYAMREAGLMIMDMTERYGADIHAEGLDLFMENEGPFIFVANHMSMMETIIPYYLFSIPLSYVIKDTLLKTPIFSKVLIRTEPISVERKNPGKDLKVVMEEGKKRLDAGRSVFLFPSGHRYSNFDPVHHFNSLGVKLALRTGYPVVPVAIKTDFWANGKLISYFGKIDPDKKVRIKVGKPLAPKGKGKEVHQQVVGFISENLKEWGIPVVE